MKHLILNVLIALACIGTVIAVGTGCALTTPDGVQITIDAEQLDALLLRLENYIQAREVAERQGDTDGVERWQRQIDAEKRKLGELQGTE